MANRLRGEIDLELDKPRTWRLSLRNLERLETALTESGRTPDDWWGSIKNWGIKDWALLVWAGLGRKTVDLSLDDVMELIEHDELLGFQAEYMRKQLESTDHGNKKKLLDLGIALQTKTITSIGQLLPSSVPPSSNTDLLQEMHGTVLPGNWSATQNSIPSVPSESARNEHGL